MLWLLLCVMAASIAYAVFVISHYNNFMGEALPRVKELEAKAEESEKRVEKETLARSEAQEGVEKEKEMLNEMKRTIALLEVEIKKAQERETQLEMEVYKHEFKRNKKLQA